MKKWMLLTDDDSEGLKESPKKLKLRRIIKGNNDDETIGRVTAFKKLFYGFFNNFFSFRMKRCFMVRDGGWATKTKN